MVIEMHALPTIYCLYYLCPTYLIKSAIIPGDVMFHL